MERVKRVSPKRIGWTVGQGSRYNVAGWVVYQPNNPRLGDVVCSTRKQALREWARGRTAEEWDEIGGIDPWEWSRA